MGSHEQSMRGDRDSWVPAEQHPNYTPSQADDDDIYEEEDVVQNGETVREEERAQVAA